MSEEWRRVIAAVVGLVFLASWFMSGWLNAARGS